MAGTEPKARGRKRKFTQRMVAPFPPGTFGRMDAVLGATEDRTDLVRDAVERELARREREARRRPGEEGPAAPAAVAPTPVDGAEPPGREAPVPLRPARGPE